MLIKETFENVTEGHLLGENPGCEPWTTNLKLLFRDMSKEYGRCTGSIYIDQKDGSTKRIGWHFEKRMQYEDARDSWPKEKRFYVRGVWVTFLEGPDEVIRKEFPIDLDKVKK